MPTPKHASSNINNYSRNQEATLKDLECKKYLERNMWCIIQNAVKCFEQGYGDMMNETDEDAIVKYSQRN